ncbi:MAG: DUF4238 domain-containing protein [Chloroflexi bacterium]|nr:DUF4238 domain-containing protein [Chloroflexota bacterium]
MTRSGAPPKAHHFIPVGHLARFGESGRTQRDAKLWVFDKLTGRVRHAKAGRVATQNDLYTYRVPMFPPGIDGLDALAAAISDAANRDWWVETDKAEIEHRGVQALAALERMPAGTHRLTESARVDMVAYVALQLTQHPTMMRRRAAAAVERFWTAAERLVSRDSPIASLFTGLGQGDSVLGLIPDQLSLARELNYLSWSVVRWLDGPGLVLGDNAVVARYPDQPFAIGDAWTPGATFTVPISPATAVFLGGFDPGLVLVEDRPADVARREIPLLNTMSWIRAERHVFGLRCEDLEATRAALGPFPARLASPDQLTVRESVLPRYALDDSGALEVIPPPSTLEYDHQAAFRERFARSGKSAVGRQRR